MRIHTHIAALAGALVAATALIPAHAETYPHDPAYNDPNFWERALPASMCLKQEDPGTPYTVRAAAEGWSHVAVILKAGAGEGANEVFRATAGDVLTHPSGKDISHVIVCKDRVPEPTPDPEPTPTVTADPTPESTPEPSVSVTPSTEPSVTPEPTPTVTVTATPDPQPTQTVTVPAPTETVTEPAPTVTATETVPGPTTTATVTTSPEPQPTVTTSATQTVTPTPTYAPPAPGEHESEIAVIYPDRDPADCDLPIEGDPQASRMCAGLGVPLGPEPTYSAISTSQPAPVEPVAKPGLPKAGL